VAVAGRAATEPEGNMTNALHPRRARRWMLVNSGFLAVLASLLAFAPAASAARDPIASGSTDLHMKKGFMRKLGNAAVTVTGIRGGTTTGNKVGLTGNEGMLDPTDVEGHLESNGGFKLAAGARGVPIYDLTVNTVKGAVYASVAKAHMEIGTFADPIATREGFGANFKATQLFLTEKATRRISNRLGLRGNKRLKAGRVISNLYATAQPRTVTVLPQGDVTLTPDAALLAKFAAKGVKMPSGFAPMAPATAPTPTTLQFPIAGGTLAPDGSGGKLAGSGGIEITKKTETISPQVKLKNLELDFGSKAMTVELEILPVPPFPGATGRTSIADLTLPANSVVADPATRQIAISGAEAKLQAVAASTLNSVFDQPAPEPPPSSDFVVGDPFGTISLLAQAQ
jgi:hypothetical protein